MPEINPVCASCSGNMNVPGIEIVGTQVVLCENCGFEFNFVYQSK